MTTSLRCNKCGHRAITGTTSHDGACECGGLVEAVPNVVDLAAFLADRVARDARELAAYVHDGACGDTRGDEKRAPQVPRGSSRHGHSADSRTIRSSKHDLGSVLYGQPSQAIRASALAHVAAQTDRDVREVHEPPRAHSVAQNEPRT